MMMDHITAPIDGALLDRVEALQSTAEYIECLADIVQADVQRLHGLLEDRSARLDQPRVPVFALGEWRQIMTLLNLLQEQARIVRSVGADVDVARMASPPSRPTTTA